MRSIIRILGSARELWPYYAGIVACSLGLAATGLLTPFIIKSATDYVVAAHQGQGTGISTVVWLAGALLAAELANTLLSNIGGYLGDTMAAKLRATLSGKYFAKLLSLPQPYFDGELTGTVINRLSRSITETTSFLNMFANSFFQMVLTVVAVLAVTAFYSWPMALLLAVIYPIFLWLTTITSARWQVLEAEKNREFDVAGGRFAEVVGQIRVDQRQPQAPHVAPGPGQGLHPQVDHHRVDHQEHRGRGQRPEPTGVGTGPVPQRVAGRQPRGDRAHRVEQEPMAQMLLEPGRGRVPLGAGARAGGRVRRRVHQEVSASSSSRTAAAVGTRPESTTFSSTTRAGVLITP